MRTHYMFLPKPRINDDTVAKELYEELKKVAAQANIPESELTASFELLPDPEHGGHFLSAKVTHQA